MPMKVTMAKTIILAGIPFLAFPILAESGMSGDRSQHGDRDRGQSFSNQQIVQGEIAKKDGDEITLRTRNGERITFRINDQTNQLCPQGTQTSQSSSMNKDSSNQGTSRGQDASSGSSSGQNQMAQNSSGTDSSKTGQSSSSSLFGSQSGQTSGQNSSTTSQSSQPMGFKFGECNFQKGEFVKAKMDEKGNATFVRSMGDSDEYYGTGGVEGDYFVLPAGQLGGLDISDKDAHYSVKSSDGKEIGNVYRVMTNNNGDVTYAIIRNKDGHLFSVPWQALEGSGNKSFKLKVTQNQLGSLPILKEGENAGQHVQENWNLTKQERQDLAQWNKRLDRFNEDRDRYYEDTPTFEGNRKGYDRYDYDQSRQSRMNRSSGNRQPTQPRYQDQSFDDSRVQHYGFSPSEYPPPNRAPSYEGDDRRSSSYRNRQGRSSDDYRDRGDQRSMYSQGRDRNYEDPMEGLSDRYNTTTSRNQYDSQRQGADRYQSRRSGGKDYDYRPEGYRP